MTQATQEAAAVTTAPEGANCYLKEIFNALAITAVYWIDDQFRESDKNSHQEQECIDQLQALYEIGDINKINQLISTVLTDNDQAFDDKSPWGEIETYFRTKIIDTNVSAVIEFLDIKTDLSKSDFLELQKIIQKSSANFKTLSWKQWNDEKELLKAQGNSFFIVDHEFTDEPKAVGDGSDIIETLSKNLPNTSYCFLFTHKPSDSEQEEQLRNDVITSKSLSQEEQVKFSVVSKSTLGDFNSDNIDYKFGEITKSVYLRKVNVSIFDALVAELQTQLNDLRSDLSQSSAFEIEQVIFNRTRKEGCSELDLLRRFINIKNDLALSETISNGSISGLVAQIRKVQSITAPNQAGLSKTGCKKFSAYREVELFDNFINKIHSPLSAGDIFEFENDQEEFQKYILIAQDCDLILRDNGDRKISESVLIPLTQKSIPLTSGKEKRKQFYTSSVDSYIIRLPDSQTAGLKLEFDFTEAVTVNLNNLDLCVFHESGDLSIAIDSNDRFLHHLPGWNIRYKSHVEGIKKLKNPDDVATKVMNFTLQDQQLKWLDDSTYGLPAKRIQRLKSPFKNALLNKYYAYKSRNAFDHDFTEI